MRSAWAAVNPGTRTCRCLTTNENLGELLGLGWLPRGRCASREYGRAFLPARFPTSAAILRRRDRRHQNTAMGGRIEELVRMTLHWDITRAASSLLAVTMEGRRPLSRTGKILGEMNWRRKLQARGRKGANRYGVGIDALSEAPGKPYPERNQCAFLAPARPLLPIAYRTDPSPGGLWQACNTMMEPAGKAPEAGLHTVEIHASGWPHRSRVVLDHESGGI